MAEPYPILRLQTDSPALIEQLGSKPKFWFRWGADEQPWLFKFAREGTGEHWAEKIAAEIAVKIQLPAARVELAEFMGKRGLASRSFVRRKEGFDLVHGDELLGGHVIGYDRTKVFRQSSHSINNIVQAISAVFPEAGAREAQLTRFAGLMVLDALIGNTDRHHQNWGILRGVRPDGSVDHEVAPSFDHASALGRNVPADERERRLREGTVLNYARKAVAGFSGKRPTPKERTRSRSSSWPPETGPLIFYRGWLAFTRSPKRISMLSWSASRTIGWMARKKSFASLYSARRASN